MNGLEHIRRNNRILTEENRRYVTALSYYADAANIREISMIDRGEIARAALSGVETFNLNRVER